MQEGNEAMEEAGLGEEPELFVMESLQPMLFSIRVCAEKASLQRIIENHGGELTSKVGGPHTLRLLPTGERGFSSRDDVFTAQYIYDCVKQKKLLDPSAYRVNKQSAYSDDVKVLDIIRGVRSWADCTRVSVFAEEEVSDFSDDDISLEQPAKVWKTGRRPYSRKEQKTIVDYIIRTKSYFMVKGNLLWKDMERKKICPNRTWESMKEHYRKVIITNLGPYQLTKKIEAKLYEGFTGHRTQEYSSEDDADDYDQEEEGKENRSKEKNDRGGESSVERKGEGRKQLEGAVSERDTADPLEDIHKEDMVRLTDNEKRMEHAESEKENTEQEREESDRVNDKELNNLEKLQASPLNGVHSNCTQAFDVVLNDEFTFKSSKIRDLEADWGDSPTPCLGEADGGNNEEKNCTATSSHVGETQEKPKETMSKADAEEIATLLVKMASSIEHPVTDVRVAESTQATDTNHQKESEVPDDERSKDGILQTCETAADVQTKEGSVAEKESGEDLRNTADGQQITKDLLGFYNPDTGSSPECSDVSTILFSFDEDKLEEDTNGNKGDNQVSLRNNRNKIHKNVKRRRENTKTTCGRSPGLNSNSEDFPPPKPKIRKAPKKRTPRKITTESSSSGSEVEIKRKCQINILQTISQATQIIQKNTSEENRDPSLSCRSPSKRKGQAKMQSAFSPAKRNRGQVQRGDKEKMSQRNTESEDSEDCDNVSEDETLDGSSISDPAAYSDSFTGHYDRSYYPNGGVTEGKGVIRRGANGKPFWKKAYTHEEDVAILRHIGKNNAFSRVGGRELWQDMEFVIKKRSWHSLKERYRKRILPNIQSYVNHGIPKSWIPRFLNFKPMTEEEPKAKASETYRQPYSFTEDQLIVNFIITNKRYAQVRGKSLWTLMASVVEGLKGRTWLSLKERFRKNIINNLEMFGISDDEIHSFKRGSSGGSSQHKTINHRKPPVGGMFHKFQELGKARKANKTAAKSSRADNTEDEEESSTRALSNSSISRKKADLNEEGDGNMNDEMEASTSYDHAAQLSPASHISPSRTESARKRRQRATSPEIPIMNNTFMEKKRKLFTEPYGNRILTPQVSGEEISEEKNEKYKIKRRKLKTTILSDEASESDKSKSDQSAKAERQEVDKQEETEIDVVGGVDDGPEVPFSGSGGNAEVISEEDREQENVGDDSVGKLVASRDIDESSAATSVIDKSVDLGNATITPPQTSPPETTQRISPRKRNSLKFKEQNSSASLSETSEVDVTGVTDTNSSTDNDGKRRKSNRNQSLREPSPSPEKRITRYSLENEKTLPRQKLRAHVLQKKR